MSKEFNEAVKKVKGLKSAPKDWWTKADLLEIYALYKQATDGDIGIEKPRDAKGVAKWDAWNGKKGLGEKEAQKAYVEKAKELSKTYD